MPTTDSDSSTGLTARILSATSSTGATVKALFQPTDSAESHAEVIRLQSSSSSGSAPSFGGANAGFSMNMGWIWITGQGPLCKTRRVVGASDGTTYFVRSTAALDQFYFVGPTTSRVQLTPAGISGRPPVVIDAIHRYAESDGGAITVRDLSPSSPVDAEFLLTLARARVAAGAAGLDTE